MLITSNGTAIQRPVLSPDGRFLAVLTQDGGIHMINIAEAVSGYRFINRIKVPGATRPFLKECSILRWSPELMASQAAGDEADEILSNTTSECEFGLTWLSLSDGKRLIALSTDLRTPRMMSTVDDNEGSKSNILVDYSLGGHFGKVTLVEFVFNHRHALVMFQFGSAAVVLSMTSPQRTEIPHVKYPDAGSLAVAPDARYFALLRREKGQDRVTVFELEGDSRICSKSFDCHTQNAQNVTWCPSGDPVLAVWDSAALGAGVSFFTAQGHPLRQLNIGSSAFGGLTSQPEGLGITHWAWKRAGRKDHGLTVQELANGQKQVLIRYQSKGSMRTRTLTRFTHPDIIDGSKTLVWQESSKSSTEPTTFTRQTGTFEALQSASSDARPQSNSESQAQTQVDLVELNSSHTMMATRLRNAHRTLFLWKTQDTAHPHPHPHAVLIFSHPVRQIHFHPFLPNLVIIITASTSPRVFAWYQENLAPICGMIPIHLKTSTDLSGAWLPECSKQNETYLVDGTDTETQAQAQGHRCPFLFTSTSAFEVGYLSSEDGHRLVFESILNPNPNLNARDEDSHTMTRLGLAGGVGGGIESEDSTTEIIETPSRPARRGQYDGGDGDELMDDPVPVHSHATNPNPWVW